MLIYPLEWPQYTGLGQGEVRSWDFLLDLMYVQGPKHLVQLALLPRHISMEPDQKVEQQGLELVPLKNADIASGN